MTGLDLFWSLWIRYRVAAPARAVTIHTEAKSCTLEGSPKAAKASRNRGSTLARSAGFSRTIFPSGPTFRSNQVIASRSPLDTFSSCDMDDDLAEPSRLKGTTYVFGVGEAERTLVDSRLESRREERKVIQLVLLEGTPASKRQRT